MNLSKLREAEAGFLQRYPGGFDDPALAAVNVVPTLAPNNAALTGFLMASI